MEPYRPYVDLIVCNIMETTGSYEQPTVDIKKQLLSIANIDVIIDGKTVLNGCYEPYN
jgi:CRISPR-associated protein Cas1